MIFSFFETIIGLLFTIKRGNHSSRKTAALLLISSFLNAFFRSMSAPLPKITALVVSCDYPSLPRKLRLPRLKFGHKFACSCEASELAFRDEAGEGCVSSCSDACPLPSFFPSSLFPFPAEQSPFSFFAVSFSGQAISFFFF